MWIEELKNGKYKAVERYTDPVTGKAKKVSVTIERDTRTARKEAQRLLEAKIEEALIKTDYDNMTVGELCDLYIESLTKPQTARSMKIVTDRIKNDLDPSARINQLSASYVINRTKHESDTKYNKTISVIKIIIRWGYANDYVKDKSWIDKIQERQDNKKERIEDKYLEKKELDILLGSMKRRQYWKLLTEFLVLSGLRIGEALALSITDIDNTYIHITKTIDTGDKEQPIMNSPKTASSNRDVFIQPELSSVISEIKKWRLLDMVHSGVRTDLFFPSLTYKAYHRYFVYHTKKYLGRKLTPHALRHTHVSMLAASGMSLEAISRRVGHSDSNITRKIYFHVTDKLKEKEEKKLSKIKIL